MNRSLRLFAVVLFIGVCLFMTTMYQQSTETIYLEQSSLSNLVNYQGNQRLAFETYISTLEKDVAFKEHLKQLNGNLAAQITEHVLTKLNETQLTPSSGPCPLNPERSKASSSKDSDLPIIYVVTPTYRRPEQIPELTRLAQTLVNVPAMHWILVEDSDELSPEIGELLTRYKIPFTHLFARMPAKYHKDQTKPRGVSNRNAAMEWIRQNAQSGVVYFADDDNVYDIRLFEKMRYTKKVSMWPVGLMAHTALSSPVIKDGKVIDFFDSWLGGRKFPVDMAGFAVSLDILKQKPSVTMPFSPGYEEDGLLRDLGFSVDDIEPKAENCTKILVWHTRTVKASPANKTLAHGPKFKGTNIESLQNFIV